MQVENSSNLKNVWWVDGMYVKEDLQGEIIGLKFPRKLDGARMFFNGENVYLCCKKEVLFWNRVKDPKFKSPKVASIGNVDKIIFSASGKQVGLVQLTSGKIWGLDKTILAEKEGFVDAQFLREELLVLTTSGVVLGDELICRSKNGSFLVTRKDWYAIGVGTSITLGDKNNQRSISLDRQPKDVRILKHHIIVLYSTTPEIEILQCPICLNIVIPEVILTYHLDQAQFVTSPLAMIHNSNKIVRWEEITSELWHLYFKEAKEGRKEILYHKALSLVKKSLINVKKNKQMIYWEIGKLYIEDEKLEVGCRVLGKIKDVAMVLDWLIVEKRWRALNQYLEDCKVNQSEKRIWLNELEYFLGETPIVIPEISNQREKYQQDPVGFLRNAISDQVNWEKYVWFLLEHDDIHSLTFFEKLCGVDGRISSRRNSSINKNHAMCLISIYCRRGEEEKLENFLFSDGELTVECKPHSILFLAKKFGFKRIESLCWYLLAEYEISLDMAIEMNDFLLAKKCSSALGSFEKISSHSVEWMLRITSHLPLEDIISVQGRNILLSIHEKRSQSLTEEVIREESYFSRLDMTSQPKLLGNCVVCQNEVKKGIGFPCGHLFHHECCISSSDCLVCSPRLVDNEISAFSLPFPRLSEQMEGIFDSEDLLPKDKFVKLYYDDSSIADALAPHIAQLGKILAKQGIKMAKINSTHLCLYVVKAPMQSPYSGKLEIHEIVKFIMSCKLL